MLCQSEAGSAQHAAVFEEATKRHGKEGRIKQHGEKA